jgi:acetylornithine deacetylase
MVHLRNVEDLKRARALNYQKRVIDCRDHKSPNAVLHHVLSETAIEKIAKAVEDSFESQIEFLSKLVQAPSLRGNEAAAQDIVEQALSARGYAIDRFGIDLNLIDQDPAFSPCNFDLKDSEIVVGIKKPRREIGRSLALNAHIDVVPTGGASRWTHEPFSATRADGWLYGRGAGDMKAGLSANLFALEALATAGFDLLGTVQFQSVIEEEVTGNGAAMVLARGYKADAILISEPTDEKVVCANTGVIKFAITVQGVPAHPFEVEKGRSAIDIAFRAIEHLRSLEAEWIAQSAELHSAFADIANPISLTIGTITGGEWLASVPSECWFEGRIGFLPHENVQSRATAFEAYLREAFLKDPFLSGCPTPEIEWVGVMQGGFVLEPGSEAEAHLSQAHQQVAGPLNPLQRFVMPCYLDASVFALHGGIPSLVYGPVTENIHAVDERVSLASLKRVTKTIALFAAAWCGVDVR